MTSADPALMRAINRFQVMDAIRRHGPISRVEIADKTELSPTTVSAITLDLLTDHLIVPAADKELPEKRGRLVPREYGVVRETAARGRPRVMLALNPGAAFVVGVKLAPDRITVAATDFRADVLSTLSLPVRINRQPLSTIADIVEDGIARCVADAGLSMGDVRGVCVGLPGVIERTTGVCRQSTLSKERDMPLGAELERRLEVKVSVDTDANLVALAESWFGQAKGMDDFMVVSVEQSLGLGIMHQGELFRGASGLCPDLGDLLVPDFERGGVHRLSDLASVSAMLVEAGLSKSPARSGRQTRVAELMQELVDAAASGDTRAVETLARAGRGLGAAIASLTTLFAPARVILAGIGMRAGAFILDPLRELVARNTPVSMREVTEIVVHEWTDDIWARGAAAMTLRDLYGMPWEAMAPVMRI